MIKDSYSFGVKNEKSIFSNVSVNTAISAIREKTRKLADTEQHIFIYIIKDYIFL
jgi:hypothetical protein